MAIWSCPRLQSCQSQLFTPRSCQVWHARPGRPCLQRATQSHRSEQQASPVSTQQSGQDPLRLEHENGMQEQPAAPAAPAAVAPDDGAWQAELKSLAAALHDPSTAAAAAAAAAVAAGNAPPAEQDPNAVPGPERAFLIGVHMKMRQRDRSEYGYSTEESLAELQRLAETAGLEVVGSTSQQLDAVSTRTYIGSGKLSEVEAAVAELGAETVIFDDELTPGQMRNLERALGSHVRLCDRTALILDIFSQRAATREGQLQVELARSEYQLPRLTRMWGHLERQAGGRVRGMGEKQIEVDKRLLRARMGQLRKSLEDVRAHRRQHRLRRAEVLKPVVALVGYTNAGKSTLMNRLSDAGVLEEDKLFATLDPTTRRVELSPGHEALFTDTVGFIQKLPTQLVAAFRATLEEIAAADLLVHVVDVSHPNAAAQTQAVMEVLADLKVDHLPMLSVWNKVDACSNPEMVRQVAAGRPSTVCMSARTGEGMAEFMQVVNRRLREAMVLVDVLVPWAQSDLCSQIRKAGAVDAEQFTESGTRIAARVPLPLAQRLQPLNMA